MQRRYMLSMVILLGLLVLSILAPPGVQGDSCHCTCDCEDCDSCCDKLGDEAYGVCMILCGRRCSDENGDEGFKQVINASNNKPMYLLQKGSECGDDVVEVLVYNNPLIDDRNWGKRYSLDTIHGCRGRVGHGASRTIIALSVTTAFFGIGCLAMCLVGMIWLCVRRPYPYEVVQ